MPEPDLTRAPMGGAVVDGGATFRIWAPRASAVYISGDFNSWRQDANSRLNPIGGGHWAIFIPGLRDGDQYLFYIDGVGSKGYKRDPRARQLTFQPAFPASNCMLRDPSRFPWHNTGYRTPPFSDLVIYQLHIGAFSPAAPDRAGKFLDVVQRLPHLAALGVNAIEPLPIQEYPTMFSLGYNGTDYYSPENDYGEADEARLQQYFNAVNALLQRSGQPPYPAIDVLRGSDSQLRALVDLCHVYGLAVIFDVVYNHAGGGFDGNSIWFLDRMPENNPNDSLYFTDHGWAGGQVFAFWNADVKQFLIDNAKLLYEEYRIDGLRYDEVSVMDHEGGWQTCQFMTDTLRYMKPEAVQIAEYWPVNAAVLNPTSIGGAGFDATWHSGLRDTIRPVIGQSSGGAFARVNMSAVADAIANAGLQNRWRAVQFIENHDIVRSGRAPRVPRLADSQNPRSWYARSRSRVALGLLLTAPGIPLLFMGQEILEDKQWDDAIGPNNLIWWDGLQADKSMADYLRFATDLITLRRRQPALRGEGCSIVHVHDDNRVLAFQRWVEGRGRDIMVIATLNEQTWYNYQIGFPGPGRWIEVFNSDVYDNFVNPIAVGNGGSVEASGGPLHGLSNSSWITIPANGFVVFARDAGD